LKNSRVPHSGIIIENIFVLRSLQKPKLSPGIQESKAKAKVGKAGKVMESRKSQDFGLKLNLQVKLSPSISIPIVWSLDFVMASIQLP